MCEKDVDYFKALQLLERQYEKSQTVIPFADWLRSHEPNEHDYSIILRLYNLTRNVAESV